MIMHELAICRSLLKSVEETARTHEASSVVSVSLSIGPLSGVEAPLLERAWSIARAGTVANEASLLITVSKIRVKCSQCGHEGPATVNSLICENCDDWRVRLVSGDEMMLVSLELEESTAMEDVS
jgi:hydrogenase nickel incorporation protein HypA/HybF